MSKQATRHRQLPHFNQSAGLLTLEFSTMKRQGSFFKVIQEILLNVYGTTGSEIQCLTLLTKGSQTNFVAEV
jgi:hypothetical protein